MTEASPPGSSRPTSGGDAPGDRVPLHRGEAVAVVVLVGYLGFVVVSAATAPSLAAYSSRDDATTGGTLVGLQGSFVGDGGRAVVLGADGSVRWRSPETRAHFDVQRLDDGRILAAFVESGATACGDFEAPCARTGFRVYDPARRDPVVREWTYPVRNVHDSEVHAATMLPDGSVAVAGMEYERLLVVDRAGDVAWQWNASSYYDAPDHPTTTDWLHVNDVDYLGDDRFLVSVRNANQLLVIERGEGVVEVVNEDRDPAVLNEQHNPQWLGPGRVLVADSHNDRVVELRKRDGDWTVAWQLGSAGGVDFFWPRDADLLANGHLLVTDSKNDRVVEVDRDGTVHWSASTPLMPYEADRNGTEYPPGLADAPPNGSLAGGETDGEGGTDGGGDGQLRVPLVWSAYAGFAGVLPVPVWFTQWHFLGGVAVVLALVAGATSSVRHRLLA